MEHCYRCDSQLIKITPGDVDNIMFFECPSCKCQYAKSKDSELHDRWLMPITLPLYSVINENNPVSQAITQAKAFFEREDLDLEILKRHIHDELGDPKQKVAEIFEYINPDEGKLREYLKYFVWELERLARLM